MDEAKPAIATGPKMSAVWVLPLIALVLGAWVVFYTLSTRGPAVEVRFASAQGLTAQKTKVKYRDVEIGVVQSIRLGHRGGGVVATIQLQPEAEELLGDDARFWVVTARVGAGSVTGLETLLSGAYVEMSPAETMSKKREYEGLEKPPWTAPGAAGIRLQLSSKHAHSLGPGDAVVYHGFKVGRVESSSFDPISRTVSYQIFIDAPYDALIDSSVRFWDISGISLQMDAGGFQLSMGSLQTILLGGITFGTPEGMRKGLPVESGIAFRLHKNYAEVMQDPYRYGIYYVVEFSQSIRGLKPGAPVEYRGINLGYVVRIMLEEMLLENSLEGTGGPIPVLIYLEPGRLEVGDTLELAERLRESIAASVSNGMRANLASGNLLTGAMYVNLDFFPDAEQKTLGSYGEYASIPTIGGDFGRIMQQVTQFLEKLNKLPLDATFTGVNAAVAELQGNLGALRGILDDADTQALAGQLLQVLQRLEQVAGGLTPDSPAYQSLNASLRELNLTLKNFSDLSRTISEKPNALIMPVEIPADPIPEARP
jgi:paraquat-inducible protein B